MLVGAFVPTLLFRLISSLLLLLLLLRPFQKHGILHGIHFGHCPKGLPIAIAHHVAGIAIEGRGGVRITQQCQYGPTGTHETPRGRPFLLQYIQTYLTCSEVNIWVEDLNNKI